MSLVPPQSSEGYTHERDCEDGLDIVLSERQLAKCLLEQSRLGEHLAGVLTSVQALGDAHHQDTDEEEPRVGEPGDDELFMVSLDPSHVIVRLTARPPRLVSACTVIGPYASGDSNGEPPDGYETDSVDILSVK